MPLRPMPVERFESCLRLNFDTALFLKVQGPLFERVNVAHHQDRDEAERAPEDHATLFDCVSVNHRPRIHEDDLEVEKNEEHRHEIKLHTETRLPFTLRDHPAFV